MHLLACLVGFLAASPAGASPASRRAAKPTYRVNHDRARAVREAFDRGWNGYKQYAFPHDSLRPVSNKYDDDR